MNIAFSGTLLRFVNFQKTVNIEAATVADALADVARRFPQSRPVLFDHDGHVRQVHQVFLNGKQLRPDELGAPVAASDRVDLLTAIAGG
jgi:sulfur-carrier protein